MKIIGVAGSSFKGDDGKQVTGYNVYLSWPLSGGDGEGATRVYVTDKRLATWTYFPQVGDEVEVSYNRYGKATFQECVCFYLTPEKTDSNRLHFLIDERSQNHGKQ